LGGDRRDDGCGSDDAEGNKQSAGYFQHSFHFFLQFLSYGHQEHPERQGGTAAVEKIARYGILAPGLIFLAEHARHDHDDSDKLQDSEDYRAGPPPHFSLPPLSC
jgi:hypothetical protein